MEARGKGQRDSINDTRSSRCCDEAEYDEKCIAKQGIKTESGSDLNHKARNSWYCDGGATSENKNIFGQRVKSESGAGLNDEGAGLNNEARSSRSFAHTLHFELLYCDLARG